LLLLFVLFHSPYSSTST